MSEATLMAASFAVAVAGMLGFALATDRHWHQLLGTHAQTRPRRIACKTAGATLVGLSFLLCAIVDPPSMAILVWPMLLGAAAATIVIFLTLRAHG